jgi:hypothetical protein
VIFFSLAAISGALGIVHDQQKWMAVLVGIVAGGFLLVMLHWNGFA